MTSVYVVQRGQEFGDKTQWEDLAIFKTRKLADEFVNKLKVVIPSSHHDPDWEDGYADDEEYVIEVTKETVIENEKPFKKLVKEWDWE